MVGCQYGHRANLIFSRLCRLAGIAALKGKAVGVSRFGAFSDFVARHVLKKIGSSRSKTSRSLQLGGTQEIIAAMQKNLVPRRIHIAAVDSAGAQVGISGNCSRRKPLRCRSTMAASSLKARRCEPNARSLKKVLRATIAAYDLAIQEPAFAKNSRSANTPARPTVKRLDATYKENVKDYALACSICFGRGLTSIIDFRAEATAEAKEACAGKNVRQLAAARASKRNDRAKVKGKQS